MAEEWQPRLVWVRGPTGSLDAQMWWDKACESEGGHKVETLSEHLLQTGDHALSFNELVEKYPAPTLPDYVPKRTITRSVTPFDESILHVSV